MGWIATGAPEGTRAEGESLVLSPHAAVTAATRIAVARWHAGRLSEWIILSPSLLELYDIS